MTIAGRRESRFSDITKVRNLGTKFYAMSGKHQTVIIAQNNGGLAEVVAETPKLGASARDVTYNSLVPTLLYVLTDTGVQLVDSSVTPPTLGVKLASDPGDGRWILTTANGGVPYIVAPVDRGIQVLTLAGVQTSVSVQAGVESCIGAAIGTDDVVYVVDEKRAKIHVWRIIGPKAVYVNSFKSKSCRDVVQVVLDTATNVLFVQCKHRIVGFNVTAAGTADSDVSVTLRQDYGNLKAEYTDFVKIGANKYWIGVDADSALNAAPEFYGRTYAAWDTPNQVLFTAFPDMSIFAASNVTPYVGEIQIPPVPGIPDVPAIVVPPVIPPPVVVVPPVVTPAAPVITSSLTASVTEDSVFNYVITATGTGPIYYAVTSPPAWLTSINHVTGAISGIPPDAGTVNVTITATNSGGTDSKILVVTVASAIGNNTGVYTNNTINDAVVIGAKVYVVGSFTSVTDSSGTYTRNRVACLDVSTGLWTSWNPNCSSQCFIVSEYSGDVCVGTQDPAATFGGTAVGYLAKLSPVTGAADTGFIHTFNGPVRGLSAVGSSLYVCGSFQTVNGSARRAVCRFTGASLDSWYARTSDTPENLFLTSAGGTSPSLNGCVALPGGGVFVVGGGLRAERNAGGNWAQNWSVVADSGVIAQTAEGLGGAFTLRNNAVFLASSGLLTWAANISLGTQTNLLPLGGVSGKSVDILLRVTTGGSYTTTPALAATGGSVDGLSERPDGKILVAGAYTALGGNAAYQILTLVNPASGAVDAGFTFRPRLNATAQGVSQAASGTKALPGGGAVVAFGSFGNVAGGHQYGGFPFQGVLVLNGLTGARL